MSLPSTHVVGSNPLKLMAWMVWYKDLGANPVRLVVFTYHQVHIHQNTLSIQTIQITSSQLDMSHGTGSLMMRYTDPDAVNIQIRMRSIVNESDVGHIGFEIMAKTVVKFLCFILFLALTNSS